jgi:DNA repair protein RecO (recombination protein O)
LALEKKRGIILQSKTIGEADAMLTLLSEDGSKLKFLVKGIKKSKKRPIVASEIGSIVCIDFYFHANATNVYNVKEISLEKRYDSIKNDYISTLFLFLFLELMEKTIPEGEKESRSFILLYLALEGLEKHGSNIIILPFFKYKLLSGLGVVPKDFLCKKCGTSLIEKKYAKINSSTFETACQLCENFEERDNDIEILRFFKEITKKNYDSILKDTIPSAILLKSDKILDTYIFTYLGIESKSSEMLYRSLSELKLI